MAADVCAALDLSGDPGQHTRRLDDDEKGLSSIQTLGGTQQVAAINESGLYSLILGSRKPEAKRFKKWVTAEVLPAIRKTVQDTGLTTDSRRVAKHFGKRHADVLTGKTRITRHKMTEADAKAWDPAATPVDYSHEVRLVDAEDPFATCASPRPPSPTPPEG